MADELVAIQEEEMVNRTVAPERQASSNGSKPGGLELASAKETVPRSLLSGVLGHVTLDGAAANNTTAEAMAAADQQKRFQREVYVGIKDTEQNIELLGRIVE